MAKIDFCIICGQKFTDRLKPSKEHIIPKALGNENLITYNVCETSNNKLGTNVDAYLTDYIIVKILRKYALEKDKDIQIFDSTLTDDNGNKYRIRDNGPEVIPSVIAIDREKGRFRVGAATYEEGIELAKKRLKREFNLDDKQIEDIINDPQRIRRLETQSLQAGTFEQNATIDFSRFKLAVLKVAYEYAVEKLDGYENDSDAAMLRAYLLSGEKGKKSFLDEEYNDINSRCSINEEIKKDIDSVFSEVSKSCKVKVRHMIRLVKVHTNQLICEIRMLDSDILTFAVLLSKDACKYLKEKSSIMTFITDDDVVHDKIYG